MKKILTFTLALLATTCLVHSADFVINNCPVTPVRVVSRVVLPMSIPGVVSGITMVFMPAVTTFAISRMLSSGMIYLVGDMIEDYFIAMNNRNVGSTISLVMLVLIILSIGLLRKVDPDNTGGGLW